jgi:sugar lactone lactonase YvrE
MIMDLPYNKMNLELIFYAGSSLLEGPCWDNKEQILYFVSIEQCLIYSINMITSEIKSFKTDGQVGCVVVKNDGFLLSAEKSGIYKINPKTGVSVFLGSYLKNDDMRYNDGKLDAVGRFLIGTKGENKDFIGEGELISFSEDRFNSIIQKTTISNGLGFSSQGDTLYFIDTPTKKVGKYSYNVNTGEAIFDNYIIEIDGEGYPDGMCVDIDDMIWVAEWGGGKVCKWNPKTGKKIIEIILPCNNVTSCCIGGKNMDILFITTAKDNLKFEPLAGGLFKMKIR